MAIYNIEYINSLYSHSHENETPVFEATIDDILTEDLVDSNTKLKGGLIIRIFAKEGDYIPHFHFYKGSEDRAGGCIMLFDNRYFEHANHVKKIEDSKSRKILNNWLKTAICTSKNNEHMRGKIIWTGMVDYWFHNSKESYNSDISMMPDYTYIKPY